jgi:hypothetical protein
MQENNLCECGTTGTLNHIFFQCPIHEDATAQLIIALDNLNLNIDGPVNLQKLLQLNKNQVQDQNLVSFVQGKKVDADIIGTLKYLILLSGVGKSHIPIVSVFILL